MDKKREFGLYLSSLRVKRGFESQRQLAIAAGVSPATISRIEAGIQRAEPETLRKLAPFLGVSYEELMAAAGYLNAEDQLGSSGGARAIKPNDGRIADVKEIARPGTIEYHVPPDLLEEWLSLPEEARHIILRAKNISREGWRSIIDYMKWRIQQEEEEQKKPEKKIGKDTGE